MATRSPSKSLSRKKAVATSSAAELDSPQPDWQVSLDFGRKPIDRNTGIDQFPDDAEDVVHPARLFLRSKIFAT